MSIGRKAVAVLVATMAVAGLVQLGGASPVGAEVPLYVDWSSTLPGLTETYDPTSENDCTAGRDTCLAKTIREMQKRFNALGQKCDHNAVFALAYLRTTQTYGWARDQEAFFVDTPFVNHEDAVFAKYYFDAYDDWAAGKRADTPMAWQIAFDAAATREVTGSGNLFLGMSAHVNRDLAFVLAGIGLAFPDGSSRKIDHDKVNQFLNAVIDPLLAEEAARFDGAVDDSRDPMLFGYTSTFQLLAAWRETAWRNAERLVDAPDAASQAQVAQSIEDYAAGVAMTIKAADSYGPLQSSASRDAHCAAHNGDAAPIDYAWGSVTPW